MVGEPAPNRPRRELRIRGVGVRVQPAFILIIVFLGLAPGRSVAVMLTWVAILTASILVHEAGHAAAFRLYDHDADITLTGFGGLTAGRPRPGGHALSHGQHIVVSLAGPVAGLALGLAAVVLQRGGGLGSVEWLDDVILVNVAWGLLNLLPILPLDGGQIVGSILSIRWPDRGRRIAAIVSIAIGAALAIGLLAADYTLGGIMAGVLVGMNVGEALPQRARPSSGTTDVQSAVASMQSGRWDEAIDSLRQLLAAGPSPGQRQALAQLLGWALLGAGRHDAVDEHVNRVRFEGVPVATLRAVSRLSRGEGAALDDLAIALGSEAIDPPGWAVSVVPDDPEAIDRLADACAAQPPPQGSIAAAAVASWFGRGGQPIVALRFASRAAAGPAASAELAAVAAQNARVAGRDDDARQWDDLAVSLPRAAPPG